MIVILGPTACGKTKLATHLASVIGGEIISADSRQVYKGMDIGTGKDLDEYWVDEKQIPYHIIDIVEPGYEFNLFDFQENFYKSYNQILENDAIPILCGGTGLYLDSILRGFSLAKVPENQLLRAELELLESSELEKLLSSFRSVHNTTDILDRKRLIRAIEIEKFTVENPELQTELPHINSIVFGLNPGREIVRDRITKRLNQRLQEGMIEEVEGLLRNGVMHETLEFYGLEYKFISWFLQKKITFEELQNRLNIAIHQFAKRQMTFFRSMEKKGVKINWLDANASNEVHVQTILSFAKNTI